MAPQDCGAGPEGLCCPRQTQQCRTNLEGLHAISTSSLDWTWSAPFCRYLGLCFVYRLRLRLMFGRLFVFASNAISAGRSDLYHLVTHSTGTRRARTSSLNHFACACNPPATCVQPAPQTIMRIVIVTQPIPYILMERRRIRNIRYVNQPYG